MEQQFNLEQYLSNGVENIVKNALKATLNNPRESAFLMQYALSAKKANKIRADFEARGEHIPPFLIASITDECNLHCSGCYAQANHPNADVELSASEWGRIFIEAEELGIAMILLAGGEPMMRLDVIDEAAKHPTVLFPVFTNGTMLKSDALALFDKKRNLIPMLSIEGDAETTDLRRGEGVYADLMTAMKTLSHKGILFGASITVTKKNLELVTSDTFVSDLYDKGCKVVLYVEYVPVVPGDLAFSDEHRTILEKRMISLRKRDMVFISFPGDEKASGGCLAAGRGFFHISANGAAEPCPFSPYSDTNIRNIPLKEALQSPLFLRLSDEGFLAKEHSGGCVLFEQEAEVQRLIGLDK